MIIIGIIMVGVSTCMIFCEFASLNAGNTNDGHVNPEDSSPGIDVSGQAGDDGEVIDGAVVVACADEPGESAFADSFQEEADSADSIQGEESGHPEFNVMTDISDSVEQTYNLTARKENPVSVHNPITLKVPKSFFVANPPAPNIYANETMAGTFNHDLCDMTALGCRETPMADSTIILKYVTINVLPVIMLRIDGELDEFPTPNMEEAEVQSGSEQPPSGAQPEAEVQSEPEQLPSGAQPEAEVQSGPEQQPSGVQPEAEVQSDPETELQAIEPKAMAAKEPFSLKGRLKHGLTFALGAGMAVTDYANHSLWYGYDPLVPALTAGYSVRMAAFPRVSIGLEVYGIYSPHLYSENTSNPPGTAAGGTHWNEMSFGSLNHIMGTGARLDAAFAVGKGSEAYVFGGVETSVPVRKEKDDPGKRVNTGIYALLGGLGFETMLGRSMSLGMESMYMHVPGYRGSVGVRIRMRYLIAGIL